MTEVTLVIRIESLWDLFYVGDIVCIAEAANELDEMF